MMIYIRYHSISFASASVEKQKKTSSCFWPTELVGGKSQDFCSLHKTGEPESNSKVEGPIESLLRGNNCLCFEWEKGLAFFSLHPTRSTLKLTFLQKSSDTALEKLRMESRLWMSTARRTAERTTHTAQLSDMDFWFRWVFSAKKKCHRSCRHAGNRIWSVFQRCLHQSCLTPGGSGGGFCGITPTWKLVGIQNTPRFLNKKN